MTKKDKVTLAERLIHIVEEANTVEEFLEDMDELTFYADKRTFRAVERSLGIIGESCNKIMTRHPPFADEHPEIRLDDLRGLRHDIVHDYFMDVPSLWTTATEDVPVLRQQTLAVLRDLDPDYVQGLEANKDTGPDFP